MKRAQKHEDARSEVTAARGPAETRAKKIDEENSRQEMEEADGHKYRRRPT